MVGITSTCCCLLTVESFESAAAERWALRLERDRAKAFELESARVRALSRTTANTEVRDGQFGLEARGK